MKSSSYRLLVLVAAIALVAAALAVVTNVATAEVPHWLRLLQPAWRAWALVGILTVVSVVLAVETARVSTLRQQSSTSEQVEAAADMLADRVFRVWSQEVVTRGIYAPAPVPVRWQYAMTDIAMLRTDLNSSSTLGTDPDALPNIEPSPKILSSGLVTRLYDRLYAKLKHGRLVLIGGPGAGKTAAMALLLLQALQHRKQVPTHDRKKVPVPVWLNLGSWNPQEKSLREWVATALAHDHPYLCAEDFGPTAITQLIDAGQVTLFMDGLDEMPDVLRSRAMRRIAVESGGLRIVLTSRPLEYLAVLEDGTELPYAAVVELQPVGPAAAEDYLLEGQHGSARSAWKTLTDQLYSNPDGALASVLNTPLMLSLARSAYTAAGPTPLLVLAHGEASSLRDHLLDQVLVTAYPDEAERNHATRWLSWVAYSMENSSTGPTKDLYWWNIPRFIRRQDLKNQAGGGISLVSGIGMGIAVGLTSGLMAGLLAAPLTGLIARFATRHVVGLDVGIKSPEAVEFRWPALRELGSMLVTNVDRRGVQLSLAIGMVAGILIRPMAGVVLGISFWVERAIVTGFLDCWSRPLASTQDSTPYSAYRADLRARIVNGLALGLGFGLVSGLSTGMARGPGTGLTFGLAAGLTTAISGALVSGLLGAVVPSLFFTEMALGRREIRFIPLLETALARQVLRQAGMAYQFRHAELQERMANRWRNHVSSAEAQARIVPNA